MEINAQPGIGIKPLLSLKRHYRVSLVVWLVIFLLGLPLVWVKGQSTYTAESVFQVSPRYMKNLQSDAEVEMQSNQQYREYVNHLSKTVSRYDVLQRALANLKTRGIDPRPPALSERKYIEKLQTTLYIKPIPDTYMVKVGLEGGEGQKAFLHELINSVMASFLDTSKSEQIYGSSERLNVLNDSSTKLRGEVAALETERVTLGEKLGLTTFTDNAQNPYDSLLSSAREKTSNAEIERSRAEAVFKSFMSQREIPAELGRSLLEMRLQDMGLQTLRTEVTKRVEELSQQISGLEEKHPARAPALAEIKNLQQRLKGKEDEFDRQNFENFRQRLQASLNQKSQVEQELRQSLRQFEGQAAEFARTFQQAMRLTKSIREREQRLQQIQERLNYLDTERNALGFVRLVTPALPAEMPMGLGKTKLLLGLIIAAFGLALAMPVLIDIMDRRIRSVTEAEKLMGIPAAGWQIRREDLPTQMFSAEQTRRFVSTLIRIRTRHQRQSFAFTSVKSSGGTTTTILDTAQALSQLGARVLIVEANTFSPFSGFDTLSPGLTDYLAGKSSLKALPKHYQHQGTNLDVVCVGSERASGLQRLDLLLQALKVWESQYDYLLYDLPPVLLSADAEMLIEALGQVFLVVEAEAVVRGEVSRAKRLLQKIDPEAVGLFVNSVPLFRGSGYMEEVIIETLTRGKLSRFMSLTHWRLQWELLRTQWSTPRGNRKKKSGEPAARAAPAPLVAAPEAIAVEIIDKATDSTPSIVELNNRGVMAARNGDLEESARLLIQVADQEPTVRFMLNAAKSILNQIEGRGWNPELMLKARDYLQRVQAMEPDNSRLATTRALYTTTLQKHRPTDRKS
jgi:Mrp family chromosome partitioning ATPase